MSRRWTLIYLLVIWSVSAVIAVSEPGYDAASAGRDAVMSVLLVSWGLKKSLWEKP